jgi:DNA-binding beta-propeller fold protein YncE
MRRPLTLLTLMVALLAVPATAGAAEGSILFKQCVNDAGSNGCADGSLIPNVWDVTPSPDGRQAYVSTWTGDTLLIYDRDPKTGRVTPRSGAQNCYKDTSAPVGVACTTVRAMHNPLGVIVSPDGKNVYVASHGSSGVTIFDRNNSTGRLTQKPLTEGCLGAAAGCKPGRALASVLNLFLSPDGENIYATAQTGGGAIAILNRTASNGQLSQLQSIDGCVTESGDDGAGNDCADGTAISTAYQLTVSPDGKHLFGASQSANAITLFIRDPGSGGLTQRNGAAGCISQDGFPTGSPAVNRCGVRSQIAHPYGIVSTPNGRFVYLLGNDFTNGSIVVFERAANGLLTFRSCVNEAGDNGCSNGRGVSSLQAGAVSPDGKTLVAKNFLGDDTGGMSFFDINPTTGGLTQRAGRDGCVTQGGSTPNGAGGTIANQCRVVPTLGGEGNVQFVGDTILNYGGFSNGSAVVFDRDFAPVCQSQSPGVPHNTSVQIQLSCSDRNYDPISYAVTRAPAAGLTGAVSSTGAVFYNPFTGFSGGDSFDFRGTGRGVSSNVARVSLNVAGPPAVVSPPPGSNNNPPPATLTTLSSTTSINSLGFKKYTKLLNLAAKNLPAGATVTVTCKTKKKKSQKKGCPYKRKRFTTSGGRGTLNLRQPFKKKKVPVGTKITITITAAGFLGKQIQYTTRAAKIPKVRVRCLSASGKAGSCA